MDHPVASYTLSYTKISGPALQLVCVIGTVQVYGPKHHA